MLKELFNINKKSLINWILLKIKFLTKKKKKKKKKKKDSNISLIEVYHEQLTLITQISNIFIHTQNILYQTFQVKNLNKQKLLKKIFFFFYCYFYYDYYCEH